MSTVNATHNPRPFRNPEGSMMGSIKADIQAATLEFLGTFTFLLFALGAIQSSANSSTLSYSQTGIGHGLIRPNFDVIQLLYNSFALGFSLLMACWLFYRSTGAIFNPNVSTALLFLGVIGPVRWVMYCVAQILGAIAASAVVLALMPGPLASNTFPGSNVNKAQAVFLEMFMTAALVLSVLVLITARHGSKFAPVGIGMTMFVGSLFGYQYTGASMNTARSFGPAVVSGFFHGHWIYWVGPFAGTLLATAVYTLVRRIYTWPLDYAYGVGNTVGAPDPIGHRAYGPGMTENGGARQSTTSADPMMAQGRHNGHNAV